MNEIDSELALIGCGFILLILIPTAVIGHLVWVAVFG